MKKISSYILLLLGIFSINFATISFAESKTDIQTDMANNDSNKIIVSGTFGTCPWLISDSGSLIIKSGTLPNTILSSPWKQYSDLITTVEIEGNVKAGSYINYLFDGLSKVTAIQNLNNIDTSLTTRMMYVFRNCSSLQAVDLSGWDTSNNVTFTSMFNGCSSIISLDLSSFETGKASSYYQMFNNCPSLRELNISSFGKNGVTSGYNMFDSSNKNLASITVGQYTPFKRDAHGLPEINATGSFTGGWIGKETKNYYSSTLDFASKFDGTTPDTYLWATNTLINYVDQNGETLSNQQKILGYLGGSYDATLDDYQLIIPGYTLDLSRFPQNAVGIFTTELQTVTYVYTKNPDIGGDVTIKYVDAEDHPILESIVLSGNVGDRFSSEQKSISGYTFKELQGPASGLFTSDPQTVTYVYTKNPDIGGDVTIKYVDTEGRPILENIVLSGNVGDRFSSEQKSISGYTFKELQGPASGLFTSDPQTVTYVYTKNPDIGGDVTIKYMDTEGHPILENIVLSGNVGDRFSSEQKTISGYTFKELQGAASGLFTSDPQTVIYVYTKDNTKIDGSDAGSPEQITNQVQNIHSDLPKTNEVSGNYWLFIGIFLILITLVNYLLFLKKTE